MTAPHRSPERTHTPEGSGPPENASSGLEEQLLGPHALDPVDPTLALERDLDLFLWLRLETLQKVQQLHRLHLATDRRDAGREVPIAQQVAPGASSFAMASAILDASNTPSRAAMKEEAGRRLTAAIESMKEVDREVLALRHFEQLENREVAQILELTESGATLRYVRALKRLRSVLADLELTSEAVPGEPAE